MARKSYGDFYTSMANGELYPVGGMTTPVTSNFWTVEMEVDGAIFGGTTKKQIPNFLASGGSKAVTDGSMVGEDGFDDTLNFLVQNVTIPSFVGAGTQVHETEGGTMPFNNFGIFKTDSNDLSLSILNTEGSLCENFFIPWMAEVNSSVWQYDDRPFIKYNFILTQYGNLGTNPIFAYKYYGCYPKHVGTFNYSQKSDNELTRTVILTFSTCEIIGADPKAKEKADAKAAFEGFKDVGSQIASGLSSAFGGFL